MLTQETDRRNPPRRRLTVVLLTAGAALFVAFWTYALFFASKEARNRIGDDGWAARAEEVCAAANSAREDLADLRRVPDDDAVMLAEKAGVVDSATDLVEGALDDVVAVEPDDDKGRALVPQWEADYRTYISDRRDYADDLRAGDDAPFRETAVDGVPISDRVAVFAGDNRMPACAPPNDLSQ